MLRNVSVQEISDGKYYTANDLVRADTGGCRNCSRCCREMVDTIVLDPYDFYQLQMLGETFESLLNQKVELHVADGLILPRLKPDQKGNCPFLSGEGRCSIHANRPGFCRLFPLGRYYEGRDFCYILQVNECQMARAKVKVKKWLGIPSLPAYEDYIRTWHYFLRDLGEMIDQSEGRTQDPHREQAETMQGLRKQICMILLNTFFAAPYDTGDSFYPQFADRMRQARAKCGLL